MRKMAKRGDGGSRDGGRGEAPVISDPRFAAMHSDPRFQKVPRSKLKIAVDKRFERMFTDKDYVDPFKVDKRGGPKKQKKNGGKRTLEKYYKLEEEEAGSADDEQKKGLEDVDTQKVEQVVELKTAEDEPEESQGEQEAKAVESSSDSSDGDESSSDSSSDEEADDFEDEDEKVPTTETETRRLAVMNLDWRHVRGEDLFVLFNSFLPKGGAIESVTIYPSQFGLEQMNQEEIKGPHLMTADLDDDDTNGEEFDQEKLRQYELSRLRYYFGVVICDSVATASVLYNSCDGTEFERTSNILDLRFIPDDMKFEAEPRDAASQVPAVYEAPDYCTGAIQQSKVKLTWDDDEPVRLKKLRRKFSADEVNEDDYKAYIASDDEEEDEDDEASKQDRIMKYKALLLGAEQESKSSKNDVDMEVTFPQGLEDLNKKFLEQKERKTKADETVWESRLRKQKEKKKGKKELQKQSEENGDESEDNEDAGDAFNDPFFDSAHDGAAVNSEDDDDEQQQQKAQKNAPRKHLNDEERQAKREERIQKKQEEKRTKAELELLVMGDKEQAEGAVKGFNLKRKQRLKDKKEKHREKQEEELHSSAAYEDPRFSKLLTSHLFAVDPTDPQFKRSANKLRQVAELQQRRFQNEQIAPGEQAGEQRKRKAELSSMVRSLKRKSGSKSRT